MATGAVQQHLFCYACNSQRPAVPARYIGANQNVRACPACDSDFIEFLDPAPPPPAQTQPGARIDGQDFLAGGGAQLLQMLFSRPDGSTMALSDLMGDALVDGPGGLHFNTGANQGGFALGDFAFGPMERLIEVITAMDQQEERPTEEAFLDALPRVLVTRRASCESVSEPAGSPPPAAAGGGDGTAGLLSPGGESQTAGKDLASSQHAVVGEQCTICHDSYGHNHEVVELPCNHCFHEECIMPWLKSHHTCPVCRFKLPQGPPRVVNPGNAGQQAPGGPGGQQPFPFGAGMQGGPGVQQAEGGAGMPHGLQNPLLFGAGEMGAVHHFMHHVLPQPFGQQMFGQLPYFNPHLYDRQTAGFESDGPQLPPMMGEYEEYSNPDDDDGYGGYMSSDERSMDDDETDSLRSRSPSFLSRRAFRARARHSRLDGRDADDDEMPSLESESLPSLQSSSHTSDAESKGATGDDPADGDGSSDYEEDFPDGNHPPWHSAFGWGASEGEDGQSSMPSLGIPSVSDGDLSPVVGSDDDMPPLSDSDEDMPALMDCSDDEGNRPEPRNPRNARRRRTNDGGQAFGGLTRGFLARRGPAPSAPQGGATSRSWAGQGRAGRGGGARSRIHPTSSPDSLPALFRVPSSGSPDSLPALSPGTASEQQSGRRRGRPCLSPDSDPESLPDLLSASDSGEPLAQRAKHATQAATFRESAPESPPALPSASGLATSPASHDTGSHHPDIQSTSPQAQTDPAIQPTYPQQRTDPDIASTSPEQQGAAGNVGVPTAPVPASRNMGTPDACPAGQHRPSSISRDMPAAATISSHALQSRGKERPRVLAERGGVGEETAPLTGQVTPSEPVRESGAGPGVGDTAFPAGASRGIDPVAGRQVAGEGHREVAAGEAGVAGDAGGAADDGMGGLGRGSLLLGGVCTVAALACAGLMAVFRAR